MKEQEIHNIIRDDELVSDFEFGLRIFGLIEEVRLYSSKQMLIYSGML
jgi:hypothetical protein